MTFNDRRDKLRQAISINKLDGMYVTNLTNVRYLTGFTGSAGSLLILEKEQHFFTDGRYTTQSKEQIKNCKVHIVGSSHYKYIAEHKMITDGSKIGFEGQHMNVSTYEDLVQLIPKEIK